MKSLIIPIVVFVLLSSSNLKIQAQYPVLQRFTVEDGLPGSMVYFSMQDSKGYIWSGTDRGITRFDGHEFKLFTIKDGLPSNDVWRISEDHKGRLWLSTFGGNCYYEDGVFKIWKDKLLPSEQLDMVNHHVLSSGHFIYTLGGRNIYFLDDQDSLLHLRPRKDFTTSNDIFYINKNKHTALIFENIKPNLNFSNDESLCLINETILVDNDKAIIDQIIKWGWKQVKSYISISENLGGVVCQGELWTLDKGGFHRVDLDKLFKAGENKYIRNIQKFAPNRIWIQTKDKSYVVDTLFQIQPDFDFFNTLSINHVLTDQQSNLWISTPYGLFFLNQKARTSKTYSAEERVSPNSISQLAVNNQQEIWGLDVEGYLYHLIPDERLRLMSNVSLVNNATDLMFDQKGYLWIGGKDFRNIPVAHLSQAELLTSTQDTSSLFKDILAVKKIHFDHEGRLIVANYSSVRVLNKKNFKREKILQSGRFYGLASLDNGNTWLAGKNGLKLISPEGVDLTVPPKGDSDFFNLPTNHLVVNKDQKIWFAANSRGLFSFDGEDIDSISELQNILIQSLYIDGQEQLWAASNNGLLKISNIKYKPFDYDTQWFKEIDGLASNDVKDVIVVNDQIYAATEKGLTVLQDTREPTLSAVAPLSFSNIKINGRDTSLHQSLDLDHTQNNILIEYRSFDYQNMGSMVFEYKMEGIDSDWKEIKVFNKEYSLLSPGAYTFKLREKNNSALVEPVEQSIQFIIHPPVWEKGWFVLLCTLCLGLLIYWLLRRKVKQVKTKAEEENQLHRKFAELELRALQSQMNPHFIFNALHAIQDFIFKKDERVANRYLVKFSRLMRLFLESSKEKYIILEDEIQLLQLYIELEQLRFEDQFDFEINIPPDSTSSMIEIPSMLLQPFVENAINHGLIHLKKDGKLRLDFSEKEGRLCCIIEDNGIGRKKAMEIKERSVKSYKSRGLQLIEERQRVWSIIGNTNVDIVIEDLYDSEGTASGTRVEILINAEN